MPASLVIIEGAIEEWLRVPPSAQEPRSFKYAVTMKYLHPLRLTDPVSGEPVYLNLGPSQDDVRGFAHALLAARLDRRRVDRTTAARDSTPA